MSPSDEVELGVIAGLFGVRGEVKVHLHNPESAWLQKLRPVTLIAPDGVRTEARLKVRTGAGKRWIGAIEGLTDRDLAEALVGRRIVVPASALPGLAADEFYVHSVIGCPVWVGEARVGQVVEVHGAGPVDILEIDLGTDVIFVPCLRENFDELDLRALRIVLKPEAIS